MRRIYTIAAILLLLITAAPVLACVSGGPMSHSESACCVAMHGKCGKMAMTGCCRTDIHDAAPQLATHSPQLHIYWLASACLAPVVDSPQALLRMRVDSAEHSSPPGLLLAKTSVLRI